MADDKKSDSSQAPSPASPGLPEIIDDWDSLPLNPDGDDWDDIPPPGTDGPAGPESTGPPVPAAPIPAAADPPSAPNLPPGAAPPPDSGQIFALLGADDQFEGDDFGDQALDTANEAEAANQPEDEPDEFDLPDGLGSDDWPKPDDAAAESTGDGPDFDDLPSPARGAESTSAGDNDDDDDDQAQAAEGPDFDAYAASGPGSEAGLPDPSAAPGDSPAVAGGSEPAAAGFEPGDEASDADILGAHFDAAGFLAGENEAAGEGGDQEGRAAVSIMDKIEAELEDLPTKKVELDIEGIFLEDHDPPPAEEEAPLPEPEPQEEAAPPAAPPEPEEAPGPKKIPKIKLLMLLVPAVLLVAGLGFGLYKLFFASSPVEEGPGPLVIDPTVPPREPQPGSLDLGAFYVNFPGERSETIMEMTVVLHYKDLPDLAVIEARLPLVRDIIYLVAQGQGSQVISNGEVQSQLRRIAVEQVNVALGGNHIDYVQISQIRILQ